MKFSDAIDQLGAPEATKIAQAAAVAEGLVWGDGISVIFDVCLRDPTRRPKIGGKKDTPSAVIEKWVKKYKRGYDSRPSVSTGQPSRTIPDELIDEIISTRVSKLKKNEVEAIKFAHRLSMAAENLLGSFLEEYLAFKLKERGWYCAWGEALTSVDMCDTAGKLYQLKNRSNTENSSSVKVRAGTLIEKWYRVNALTGKYAWDELQVLTGATDLTEENFREFVLGALKKNPGALAVENNSPWTGKI